MEAMVGPEVFAAATWGSVDLGDARLNRRAVVTGARLAARPDARFPQTMRSDAEYQGLLGLLENRRVTFDKLSEPHWKGTRVAAGSHETVLFVADTTELDFTKFAKTMTGLGPIGDGRGRGAEVHTVLAMTPEPREVLGVAHQQIVLRVPVPAGVSRRSIPKAQRESRLWSVGVREIGPAPTGKRWVYVADRGADATDVLTTCEQAGMGFLIRVMENRALVGAPAGTPNHLLDAVRAWVPATTAETRLAVPVDAEPATTKKPAVAARTAKVDVSYGSVRIRTSRAKADPGLRIWVVRAWEVEPPQDATPLEWVLMTTVPVENLDDAIERIEWYKLRWTIEDYHQCVKTGCAIEGRDLGSEDRVERLLGFVGPIAARLLQLRDRARATPDAPATVVASETEVRVVAHETGQRAEAMTVRAFYRGVARLGGFRGRKGDGEPGWRTLWRGWKELQGIMRGVTLAKQLLTTTIPCPAK